MNTKFRPAPFNPKDIFYATMIEIQASAAIKYLKRKCNRGFDFWAKSKMFTRAEIQAIKKAMKEMEAGLC